MKQVLVCLNLHDVDSIRKALLVQKGGVSSTVKFDTQEVTCVYNYEIFPFEYLDVLYDIVDKRQQLKKEFDDSLSLVFKLRNEITKAGL